MPLRIRKSFKAGPARVNLSNRGVGGSVGGGGVRYSVGPRGRRTRRRSSCCLGTLTLLATPIAIVAIAAAVYFSRRRAA